MTMSPDDLVIAKALCLGLMKMDADYEYGVVRTVQEREDARAVAAAIRSMVPNLDELAAMSAELEHKVSPHIARDCPTHDHTHGPDVFRAREYDSRYPEEIAWDCNSDEPEPPTWAQSNGLAEVEADFMRRLKLIRMDQGERTKRERRQNAADKRQAKREAQRAEAARDAKDRDAYYRRQATIDSLKHLTMPSTEIH